MASGENNSVIELRKRDLENLLCQKLKSDLKVLNFTTKRLTEAGDNYGSTILDVKVTFQVVQDQSVQCLPLVAKLVQESPFLRKMFNIGLTFRKEVYTYLFVIPEYETIQSEKQISKSRIFDVFPKFYGARTNENEDMNARADDTAVLLLENLNTSGYETRDRRKGLNLKHMEFVVTNLAKFHAVSIAIKIQKPQIFEDQIMKACEPFTESDTSDEEFKQWANSHLSAIEKVPECIPHLKKIEALFSGGREKLHENMLSPPTEPFASLVHNDFWTNNMMFKYDSPHMEAPSDMKFVDFQILIYGSPVKDLIFFLFSSSECGVLENYLDYLIHLYHQEFVNYLERLGCDTKPFSFESFSEELNIRAPKEFAHIMFMINVVSAEKGTTGDTSNFEEKDVRNIDVGEIYKNRMKYFVETFASRGWL